MVGGLMCWVGVRGFVGFCLRRNGGFGSEYGGFVGGNCGLWSWMADCVVGDVVVDAIFAVKSPGVMLRCGCLGLCCRAVDLPGLYDDDGALVADHGLVVFLPVWVFAGDGTIDGAECLAQFFGVGVVGG